MVPPPALSVIVPLLNDVAELSGFFASLAGQRGSSLELLICDGGSTDAGRERVLELGSTLPFPCRLLACERGRARQLNAGARAAQAATLLFLHVDSRFADENALCRAELALNAAIAAAKTERIAGHFPLLFRRRTAEPSLPYSYYACKARLDRRGCTHGDQGLMLRAGFFTELGSFDEALPVLEDTRLADKIRGVGQWMLFDAEISTSARRFETEGLYERQTLNALIMNFAAIGWNDFFIAAADIYRCQDQTERLRLLPVIGLIGELTARMSWRRRWSLWYRTGGYVREQAWQLALYADVRSNFRRHISSDQYQLYWLERWDRYGDCLTDHVPGRFAAMLLTCLWFHWLYRRRLQMEKDESETG